MLRSEQGADPAESSLWKELLFFKQTGWIQMVVGPTQR